MGTEVKISVQELIRENIENLKFPDNPSKLYDPIKYILSLGGKRFRPAFMLHACELFYGNMNEAIKPAIGIELFHNFTLLHDDIMDNAPIRRSKPTVHKKWNRDIAILSGDAMFIKSVQFISCVRNEILKEVLDTFNQAALTVCEGQQMDMDFENKDKVTISEYLKMIEAKTATLIACCLKIGAIIGNASKADTDTIYEFGKNIGIAFQLKDDLLDVYGNTEKFGKQVGGDIIANKKTFLILKALEQADDKQSKELSKWMKNSNADFKTKVSEVRKIYNAIGVKEITEQKINEYFKTAVKYFDKISVDKNRKKVVENLVHSLMDRES